jgi:hypothetical protein
MNKISIKMIAIDSSVTKIGHNLNIINWLAIMIGPHVMFNRSFSVYNFIFVVCERVKDKH